MIYLFQGCQGICALPGKACAACGQLCQRLNCKPIKDCCERAGQQCTHFTEKPLSSFVIAAFIMSAVQLYFCFGSLEATGTATCEFPKNAVVGLPVWLYIQIGFAMLNILFAPFFQYLVWKQIMNDMQDTGATLTAPHHNLDKTIVQQAFKAVFLNDISVLFYFFAMLAYFVWSWMGGGWIMQGSAGCNENGLSGWAYYLGLCFFWLVCFYSIVWYGCNCCASSVQLSQPIDAYRGRPY